MRGSLLCSFFSMVLLASCATRPAAQPTHSWTKPCNTCIAGVENFGKVSPMLWRGSQATIDGFRKLASAGVKTVISLRDDHDDYDDFEKLSGASVSGASVKFIRIPMHAWNPNKAQLALLMKVLERVLKDPSNSRLLGFNAYSPEKFHRIGSPSRLRSTSRGKELTLSEVTVSRE